MRPRHTIKNYAQDTLGNYFCQENKNLSHKRKSCDFNPKFSTHSPLAEQKNNSTTSERVATLISNSLLTPPCRAKNNSATSKKIATLIPNSSHTPLLPSKKSNSATSEKVATLIPNSSLTPPCLVKKQLCKITEPL